MKGLKELSRDKSIVILKADKGNCTVLLRKSDYVYELENMLSDESKFRLLRGPDIEKGRKAYTTSLKSEETEINI